MTKLRSTGRQGKSVAATEMSMSAAQARARVNRFLLSQIGSQFCAGEPELDALQQQWNVPVLLVTPGLVVGTVGEAVVHMQTREIISHTDPEMFYKAAEQLRRREHAVIKTAFLRAGKR